MKFSLLIVLLISINLFSQATNLTSTDSIKITSDSLILISTDNLAFDTTQISIKDSIVIVDTLYPIYQKPFYQGSFFITRETIDMLDYRYTGNLFSSAGFSLFKDKGLIGQPNEFILYGNGFGEVGFFKDGILYNNRLTHIFDLNLIQNESIDSIEIFPLPRGFLYGADNYISALNFIQRDFITSAPYTRIKYYEGPEGEAFFDGMFNASFLKKFNFTFDVTNRKFDGTYTNSDFSIWQATVKLKYFLSNKINIIGSYSLVSSEIGLNGGVDVDSVFNSTNDINSILYSVLDAPVVYPTLRQKNEWDKFGLRLFGDFNDFYSDLNFYYHHIRERYSDIPTKDEIKNFIWGTALKQSYSPSFLKIVLNGVLEKRELSYYFADTVTGFQNNKTQYNVFSLSPVLSLYLLDSTLIPSVFYKYTKYSQMTNAQKGVGVDVTLKMLNIIDLYFGVSSFDFLYNLETDVYEMGARINYNKLFTNIKLFGRKNFISSSGTVPQTLMPFFNVTETSSDLMGFALNLKYDYWKLGFEGGFNYNSFKKNQGPLTSEIKMHFNGGIFYKDILFNNNLDLKTGFVLKYYDFESDDFKSAYQVDFTVAGIIQQTAIVYFSWENLLGEKYFIVPYYPMRERGIRFGLSWELFN